MSIAEADTDLLSTKELIPTEAPHESILEHDLKCPECGATRTRAGIPFVTKGQVNSHRWNAHKVKAERPEPKRRGRPPKAAPAKKATTTAKAPTAAKPTTPKAPPKAAPRHSLGESLAKLILQVGRVVNATVDPPTGEAIMFEAGALGVAIDGAIAGTFIDKPLQKVSGVAERFEPLVPLVTMPALVFMLSRNPAMQGMLEGELREAMEDVLVQSLPLLKMRAKRTAETIDALEQLAALDPDIASADDPIGALMQRFFTPVAAAPVDDSSGD